MSVIKKVAIAGASGNLGPAILNALIEGNFEVTVLKRIRSDSKFPSSVKVVEVDYTSLESLASVFKGQDAVVSTLAGLAMDLQIKMIDAAVAAGVKRFLPSEFGSDIANPKTRALPVFAGKVATEDYLKKVVETNPSFSYSLIRNAAFFDWGLTVNFLFKWVDGKPTIYGNGDHPFTSVTLPTVGKAVVGVLNHPAETANRGVYIGEIFTTQNKLLALAKKVLPETKWEPSYATIEDTKAGADARIQQHLYDMQTMGAYLMCAIYGEGYGGYFQKLDNELLGLKTLTDDEIEAVFKSIVTKA